MRVTAIPHDIIIKLQAELNFIITNFSPASGSCINNGGILKTSKGEFFLKWNDATTYLDMFEAEAKGLRLLKQSNTFTIPEVIVHGVTEKYQFLLLDYIQSKPRVTDFWKSFGKQLALLHLNTNGFFGLDHNNYIGSLPQINDPADNGVNFFIEKRLHFQLGLATDKNLVESKTRSQFEKLFNKLTSLLPDEKPALVHGDLWSGNLMVDENGNPCLIDPAVHYGSREADLAMTTLFGGFDMEYLDEYNHIYPLLNGYQERLSIYKLYPLLVHVNLFGKSYLPEVVSILNHFV